MADAFIELQAMMADEQIVSAGCGATKGTWAIAIPAIKCRLMSGPIGAASL